MNNDKKLLCIFMAVVFLIIHVLFLAYIGVSTFPLTIVTGIPLLIAVGFLVFFVILFEEDAGKDNK